MFVLAMFHDEYECVPIRTYRPQMDLSSNDYISDGSLIATFMAISLSLEHHGRIIDTEVFFLKTHQNPPGGQAPQGPAGGVYKRSLDPLMHLGVRDPGTLRKAIAREERGRG